VLVFLFDLLFHIRNNLLYRYNLIMCITVFLLNHLNYIILLRVYIKNKLNVGLHKITGGGKACTYNSQFGEWNMTSAGWVC